MKEIKFKSKKYDEIIIKVGDKFNKLEILDIFYKEKKGRRDSYCKCKCDCGNIIEEVLLRSIVCGNTKSCGCLIHGILVKRNYKHGNKMRNSHDRLYSIWLDMRRRCRDTKRNSAKNYINKGIKVCEEWNDFKVFKEWAIKNGYQDDLTIERKNNNKNYCPENCTWIPKSEQSKNRDSNHYLTFNNETKTLSDWARETGINRTTITSRLRNGWSIEKALTTKPPLKK